jgi:two-component system, NarL family, response regulator DesR
VRPAPPAGNGWLPERDTGISGNGSSSRTPPPAETLADGVRRVSRGERVIDPELVAAALETGSTPLTARETDVLRAASSGITTDQIAVRLSLSPATVRNYLSNAISKVGGRNRIDAIRIARDAGWL